MSSVHDKMTVDQVWVRPHSNHDKVAADRTLGQHFILYQAPNLRERTEMSFRALGKQFDWDLEKYRMSKKPSDKGNRRRLFKNFARFAKNPLGYFFWKTFKLYRYPRIFIAFAVAGTVTYFMSLAKMTDEHQRYQHWIRIQGGSRHESLLSIGEDRDFRLAIPMSLIWHGTYSYLQAHEVVVNPTYKQNYRLYLDRMPFRA